MSRPDGDGPTAAYLHLMSTENGPAAAILAPVDRSMLSELSVSDGFVGTHGGDVERIRAMLEESVGRADSRVAVATAGHSRIDAFLCAREPAADSPMYSVAPAIELVTFEVAVPKRRQGLFAWMFEALFRRDVESWIIFVVADPTRRERHESVRRFRARLAAVLGSVGFVPVPTDDHALHPSSDSTLFVRVGRGVPGPDVEDFFRRLRSTGYASVAISLKAPLIRSLLREDLERSGFFVRSVSAGGGTDHADVVITDNGETSGRLLTVRVGEALELQWKDGTLRYPLTKLDRLADMLRSEIDGRRRESA